MSSPEICNIRQRRGRRESRHQASEAQREKERQTAIARDNRETTFLLEQQHENFVAAVRKWEMLAGTKVE